jgi:NAD(P)-dependent dehydrogenase (short-subunit alcohol dehydrogenase family)
VKLDVADPATHAAARDEIDRAFGRLDVLVNNAGIAPGQDVKTSQTSLGLLRETFDTNFFGVVALTNALLKLIRRSDAGRIVNLSSGLGSLTQHSDPSWSFYDFKPLAYDASKTALNAYTVHLAYELRDTPIKVNSADPGWVKTDMGGPGANLEVADGARTSVRLATVGPDGPTGAFFHKDERLPW